jgi:hypothetical protein
MDERARAANMVRALAEILEEETKPMTGHTVGLTLRMLAEAIEHDANTVEAAMRVAGTGWAQA